METKERLSANWENDFQKSIVEQDVMQLRNKLNEIQVLTETQLKSYSMNSAEDADNRE